jgi:hypothetical protein
MTYHLGIVLRAKEMVKPKFDPNVTTQGVIEGDITASEMAHLF